MDRLSNTAKFWFFFYFTTIRGKVDLRCSEV